MKLDVKEIIKLGAILFLICAVSAVLLAFTNSATIGPIMEQRELASQKARQEVLGSADAFEKVDQAQIDELKAGYPILVEAYVGTKDGTIVGYVIKTTPGGYGGPMEVVSGISVDGIVQGVRVGTHLETPGLGAKAKDDPAFYEQYNGMDALAGLRVSKTSPGDNEILAISGATISSDAVTDGVNIAADVFKELTK